MLGLLLVRFGKDVRHQAQEFRLFIPRQPLEVQFN